MSDERFRAVDVPPATPEQAAILMAHHLALAAAYFEATDIDPAILKQYIAAANGKNELAAEASVMWVEMLDALYDREDNGR